MPFCPECHDEYDEGYTICADCGCTLVDALAAKPMLPEEPLRAMRPALLYSTDSLQSRIISNILEQEGVPVLVRDKTLSGNYVSIYSGYSVYGKKLYVDEADLPRAQQILESFLVPKPIEENDNSDLLEDTPTEDTVSSRRLRNRALILFLIFFGIPLGGSFIIWITWFLSQFFA